MEIGKVEFVKETVSEISRLLNKKVSPSIIKLGLYEVGSRNR